MPSPARVSQSTEEVVATGHRLTELSYMLSKGELPFVLDTQENLEGIAELSSLINGDVGLPGRFCTAQPEEGCVAFGCVKCQSRLIWLLERHNHVLIAGTAGYQQIISIGTYQSINKDFGQEIVYVDCEKEGEKDGARTDLL